MLTSDCTSCVLLTKIFSSNQISLAVGVGPDLQFSGNPDLSDDGIFDDNNIFNDNGMINDNSIFSSGSGSSSDFTNPSSINTITPQTGGLSGGNVKSSYTISYTGPQGHQSTIATYDNGRVDQVTDNNGHISHFTRNTPGEPQI
ncbi:hypothetical protein COCOBI_18-1230 [Coccomyxa sp. Obi]|nr:hypothetical protein COCOBI_18-1230 [Coccomyxa sp. Obi]